MALLDDFKARFPEFNTATADMYVPILEPYIGCYYGGEYIGCGIEIILNLMAHLVVVEANTANGKSNPAKGVSSKSAGSVSVSYVQSTGSNGDKNDFLRTTIYGQRYLMLTENSWGGHFV